MMRRYLVILAVLLLCAPLACDDEGGSGGSEIESSGNNGAEAATGPAAWPVDPVSGKAGLLPQSRHRILNTGLLGSGVLIRANRVFGDSGEFSISS